MAFIAFHQHQFSTRNGERKITRSRKKEKQKDFFMSYKICFLMLYRKYNKISCLGCIGKGVWLTKCLLPFPSHISFHWIFIAVLLFSGSIYFIWDSKKYFFFSFCGWGVSRVVGRRMYPLGIEDELIKEYDFWSVANTSQLFLSHRQLSWLSYS